MGYAFSVGLKYTDKQGNQTFGVIQVITQGVLTARVEGDKSDCQPSTIISILSPRLRATEFA